MTTAASPHLPDALFELELHNPSPMENASHAVRGLGRGFVGRQRPLRRLLQILRTGYDKEHRIAGATISGPTGVGKSCLVGQAIARYARARGPIGVIVLQGRLNALIVLRRFEDLALKRGDSQAEARLHSDESVLQQLERLLTQWAEVPIVIVFDDFDQNLKLHADGAAQPRPEVAAILETLLPICQAHRPKLLVTTTASFVVRSRPTRSTPSLVEIPLGRPAMKPVMEKPSPNSLSRR